MAKPIQKEIDRAWDYYKHAETLLMTRIQALLLAQSFLVVAFTVLTANWTAKVLGYPVLMVLVCLNGMFVAGLVMWKNRKLAEGLDALRENFLKHDLRVYKFYADAIREESLISVRLFAIVLPLVLIVFWLFLLGFVVFYFPSGGVAAPR